MTLPELFATHYARTNGDLVECFRVVLEADAMLKRRPLLKMRAVDDEWIDAKARAIAGAVALSAGLTFRDLSGPARIDRVTRARHDAMLTVRELTNMSYPAIGAMFGHRDHATVINGCRRAQERMRERPDTWETLRTIAVETNRNGVPHERGTVAPGGAVRGVGHWSADGNLRLRVLRAQ